MGGTFDGDTGFRPPLDADSVPDSSKVTLKSGVDCATDPIGPTGDPVTVTILDESYRYDVNGRYRIRFENVWTSLITPGEHLYFCITGLTTPGANGSYSGSLAIWQKD